MEFVDGHTLDSAMKKGERFTLDRVCDIGQQLADALGYAHRQGVVHRDIKPANILMTSREVYGSERPRITDFGIAKLAASEITTTGQMLGTPAYMPPEQFTGAPIDGRADLFSLGVILFSLAAGEQPFLGETMTAVSYKVVHVDPIPPSKLNPAIPPGLECVILKCLAKNPADRYQTGEELAQDLATLRVNPNASGWNRHVDPAAVDPNATLAAAPSSISHPPALGPAATAQKPAVPARKPSRPLKNETFFAVGLLVVAAAGAGGWYLYHIDHPVPPPPIVKPPAPQPITPGPFNGTDLPPAPPAPTAKTPVSGPTPPAKPTPSKLVPPNTNPQTATQQTNPPANKTVPTPPPVTNNNTTPPIKPPVKPTPPVITTDPHKLDPNTNSKFKIQLSNFPNGRASHGGDE